MIKQEAIALGFIACGFSRAGLLVEEKPILQDYLSKGFHGQMNYMENHFEKRLDPRLLHNGTKSIISVLYNYYTNEKQHDKDAPILSKYAYGQDYHLVIKEKLNQLIAYIKNLDGTVNARAFVDSAPVLEKAWAQMAGLGWIGKNTCLLNKDFGSFFFIAEIFIDLELDYNTEIQKNYCGQCSRCMDACPTGAIVSPGSLDARKCISYLTIELKSDIPAQFKPKMNNRVFGCDICQDVCPFNKKARGHSEPRFVAVPRLMQLTSKEWHGMDKNEFAELFKGSAVNRIKFEGLKKNLDYLLKL
jgi:epoxyqueuosine reductase